MTFKQKTDWLISMHAGIVPSDLENEMNPFFSWFLWSNFENTDIFDTHRPSLQSAIASITRPSLQLGRTRFRLGIHTGSSRKHRMKDMNLES